MTVHRRMPESLARPPAALDCLFLAVAQAAIFAMMLSISIDAAGRYLFDRPLQGSYEVTSLYFMVMLCFLGMPAMHARGGHIRLDVLHRLLARVPGRLTERLNALLAGAVFAFLAWHSGGEAVEKFVNRDTTFGAVQLPLYWSYVWVPAGCGVLALRLALEVVWPPSAEPEAGVTP